MATLVPALHIRRSGSFLDAMAADHPRVVVGATSVPPRGAGILDTSSPDPNVSRNEAVAAWIRTFPVDARLMEYLRSLPVGLRDDVERSTRAILQAAVAYLDREAEAGPIDLAIFHRALAEYLKPRFPWTTATGLDPLRSYAGWYAGHEGYLAAVP